MMDAIERIRRLAEQSAGTAVPAIDVRMRVCATLRGIAPEAPRVMDAPTLAFASLSLVVMATMFALSVPALTALRDPWAAYMSAPWSF